MSIVSFGSPFVYLLAIRLITGDSTSSMGAFRGSNHQNLMQLSFLINS